MIDVLTWATANSVCPVNDENDPITFWWALFCVFLYPVGIPFFMYSMLSWYGVAKCVEDKHKRACLQGLLEKYKLQVGCALPSVWKDAACFSVSPGRYAESDWSGLAGTERTAREDRQEAVP